MGPASVSQRPACSASIIPPHLLDCTYSGKAVGFLDMLMPRLDCDCASGRRKGPTSLGYLHLNITKEDSSCTHPLTSSPSNVASRNPAIGAMAACGGVWPRTATDCPRSPALFWRQGRIRKMVSPIEIALARPHYCAEAQLDVAISRTTHYSYPMHADVAYIHMLISPA